MNEWEGKERRSGNATLYDILLEVKEVRGDVKHLITSFDAHLQDDKENFSSIKKDVTFLQRCAFGLFGAWAFFQFLISSGAFSINNSVTNPNNNNSNIRSNNNAHVG